MDKSLKGLKPEALWKHFDQIRQCPRCSGHEGPVREYVVSFAKEKKLDYAVDEVGNVMIYKKASPGKEKAPGVILQGHLDMVCEKDSHVVHDFSKDPIKLKLDGEWLMADGTSLGADNGIGVAATLAALEDDSLVHGPLEGIFTIDEERGLTGAQSLKTEHLRGKYLLNLDSEEEGVFFIGCAGGGDSVITLPAPKEGIRHGEKFTIKIGGLKGGHSGMDINLGRGSAIKILARSLYAILEKGIVFQLLSLAGGSKRNAIPREAWAQIALPADQVHQMQEIVENIAKTVKAELKETEPGLKVTVEKGCTEAKALSLETTEKIIRLLMVLPHGVLGMSQSVAGLVESSTNLAVVATAEDSIMVETNIRSSVNSLLRSYLSSVKAVTELLGASVNQPDPYPGWAPNVHSPLLGTMKKIYRELYGKEPQAAAIHAGLETGIIGEKLPGLDMISFGPDLQHPHSPEERVKTETVSRFWDLLVKTLAVLAS